MLKMSELLEYAKKEKFYELLLSWRDDGTLMKNLPFLAVLDEYVHNPLYHPEGCTEEEYGTALSHVLECMKIADIMNYTSEEKICVLFHDIGKSTSACNYTKERPYHNFYKHEITGIIMLKCLSPYMEIDESLYKKIYFCIRYHMYLYKIKNMREFKVRKLVNSSYWPLMKKVCYCDDRSRGFNNEEEFQSNVEYAENFICK